ncbi:MAG: DHH family phosphoesterase [Lachnospiraceae bacterium]
MSENVKIRGQLRKVLVWPLFLSIILLLVNAVVYWFDRNSGFVVSLGLVIYVAIALTVFFRTRPVILGELINFSKQFTQVQSQALNELSMPYAFVDAEGQLLWANASFLSAIEKDRFVRRNVSFFFPEITKAVFPKAQEDVVFEISHEGRDYSVTLHRCMMEEVLQETRMYEASEEYSYIYTIMLQDVTEFNECVRRHEDEKMVVGLAYLDNYEEALESMEEVRRSLLVALLDRKIVRYFSEFDGLVKKIEKDKYFLVMRQRSLNQLIDQKFKILEEVKTLNIGNTMSVTLSIGIGISTDSYEENYEQSRIAIEMALGRGGDQVVIKEGEKISYFGGKSQQIEKTTRVKARVKAQALKEFMMAKERVVIMGHKIIDVDAFGAAIGVYRAAKTIGKTAHIVIDTPTTSIKPLMTRFMENSDYEDDLFLTCQQAIEMVDDNTLLVVVDTNKPSYTECQELLQQTNTIVVLDHHRRGNEIIDNAVLSYIEPYASSTCEMIAEILLYFADGIRIRNIEADSIFAGIMIDTNNFMTKTGVRTFEAAAFLRRNGADVTRVRKLLRDDIDATKARAAVVQNMEIFDECFAIAICPSDGLESPTVVASQAANELLNVVGVRASFVLTEYKKVIYISARAIDEVNVQIIMERLNGGGHLNIAGAQVEDHTIEETVVMLKRIINDMIREGEIA